jgi:hypothetical protein
LSSPPEAHDLEFTGEENDMSNGSRLIVGVMLGVALTTVGCASGGGRVRLSGAKMCQAHGGSYANKSCTYTASTKSLKASCEAQQGTWDDASEFCSIDPM